MTSTPEHPNSSSVQPSRRVLLAGLALVTTTSALPAIVAAAEEPDPHPAWHREWVALLAYLNGPATRDADDLAELPEWRRHLDLELAIGTTPARTLAGAVVQLRLLAYYDTQYTPACEASAAATENALATLERLAGEADHA